MPGPADQDARAALAEARTRRERGDTYGAIAAYRRAIDAGAGAADDSLLAVAHGNLANALRDAGEFDQAFDEYEKALDHERGLEARQQVLQNAALAYLELGELNEAAQIQEQRIAELEAQGASGPALAIALDNAASTMLQLGETAAARRMLERAQRLFDPKDLEGRAINALGRANLHVAAREAARAAHAFCEAHDLAFELFRGRVDPQHYRRGFAAAMAARVPREHPSWQHFMAGLQAQQAGNWRVLGENWQASAALARRAGDHAGALRTEANLAATLFDLGQYGAAIPLAARVRSEAAERGLARVQAMAVGTLGSMKAAGGESDRHVLGPLGAYAEAVTLLEVHRQAATATPGMDADTLRQETYETGVPENELAMLAERFHADDVASSYYRKAVEIAHKLREPFRLVNRLAGLHLVLQRAGHEAEAARVAADLAGMLERRELPLRAQFVALRTIARQLAARDPAGAIHKLREGCRVVEQLRADQPPGEQRAAILRRFGGLHRQLARLLRQAGDARGAFEALQGEKGRRLMDMRAAQGGVADQPPSAAEVASLLARLGGDPPTALIDFCVEQDGVTAYVLDAGHVAAFHVAGDPAVLASSERGDANERERRALELCRGEPLIVELVAAAHAAVPAGRRLLLVPDELLHNLPLHVTPLAGRPWCEVAPIGYLAAAGALRQAASTSKAGGALVAGDSDSDLPGAADECRAVAAALGVQPLLGADCSWDRVRSALGAGRLAVIHFAVHGRGDVRRGGRASLLLADGAGATRWVPFNDLLGLGLRADLVVFSGCSTAVAGLRHGRDVLSVVNAAAESGAGAAIGCLWPVADAAAAVFMKAFYETLVEARRHGRVDLRVVLDAARARLRGGGSDGVARGRRRNGRAIASAGASSQAGDDVLDWAPFVLVGHPLFG